MDASPLKKLPGELRNEIYELSLYRSGGVSVDISTVRPKLVPDANTQHILALTTTCEQIRRECATVFYGINEFKLLSNYIEQYTYGNGDGLWKESLLRWLDQIGHDNLLRLRSVDIDVGMHLIPSKDIGSLQNFWAPLTGVLGHFDGKETRLRVTSKVGSTCKLEDAVALIVPLTDTLAAQGAIDQVIEEARSDLETLERGYPNLHGAVLASRGRLELQHFERRWQELVDLVRLVRLS